MRSVLLAFALVACKGDGNSPDTDTDTTPVDPFEVFIHPTVEASGGGLACFTPGDDWESTEWLEQNVDPTLVGTAAVAVAVQDFESEDPVSMPTVDLWYGDAVSGAPDASVTGDGGGLLTIDSPTCQPHTYRVNTDPNVVETKTTYKAHHLYGPATGAVTGDMLSVSDITYRLIPTILGVAVDPDKAIIAGTMYGCGRNPSLPSEDDTEKVEGVQVIVYDADGNIPQEMQINYFTERFPDRFQEHTSADGLWVASNVPTGRLRVEAWGLVGGTLTLVGATVLDSEADSINIANIFAGYADGVKYPDSCLVPPAL
ncbi:MAG: hypothetical protein R3F61_30845 [Myxococcota bacterium]